MKNRILSVRLLCAALSCIVLFSVFAVCLSAAANAGTASKSSTIIVSLGDSYSSGEGNEDFYGYDPDSVANTVQSKDWLAHRSEKAWAGLLTLPAVSGKMKDHRYVAGENDRNGVNWYFAAASGAVTDNINTSDVSGSMQGKEYFQLDIKLFGGKFSYHDTVKLPGQLDVFYNTPGLDRNDVDYVTVTIGGNDVNFVEIVKTAVLNKTSDLYERIDRELDTFYDRGGTHDKIYNAYKRIAKAAPNAVIIVAGYPQLFDESGAMLGLISEDDAVYINNAASEFNRRIYETVRECRNEGIKIEFVDVEEAFDGHLAYSEDPYINEIFVVSRRQDIDRTALSSYSLHPNEEGQKKYAEAVQARLNELEEIKRHSKETSDQRNVVLVMNDSGGTPLPEMKKAARTLVDSVVSKGTAVGVVSAHRYAEMKADINSNAEFLKNAVGAVRADETANVYAGLEIAERMLEGVNSPVRMIVIMSDGFENGKTADDFIKYADALKEKGITLCTLGFFGAPNQSGKTDMKKTMRKIATRGYDHMIENGADPLSDAGDIADIINGQNYVYMRIECPADVKVTSRGETLDSKTGNTHTSFGILTIEEKNGADDTVKILRLREDRDYRIEIRGSGEGIMNVEAGFTDKYGNYLIKRKISGISTGKNTYAEMNATRYMQTVLKLDEDGDGVFDNICRTGEEDIWSWDEFPSAVLLTALATAMTVCK